MIALGAACATAPPAEEVPSAESYYRKGLETLKGRRVLLLRDVDYALAIELFQEVSDNYPYSEYATLAELKIADIHFQRKSYEEAESYYQDFVEFHPKHPEVPYAIYRNGLSAFRRIRESNQDQTATQYAIAQFRVLLERFPDSEYASKADQQLQDAVDQLAAHEVEVGMFYYERGEYHSAAKRFREALQRFPDHSDRLHTMVRLGHSLKHMKRYEEAEEIFQRVLAIRSGEELSKEGENDLLELGVDLSRSRRDGDGRLCITYPSPSCARQLPAVRSAVEEEPLREK